MSGLWRNSPYSGQLHQFIPLRPPLLSPPPFPLRAPTLTPKYSQFYVRNRCVFWVRLPPRGCFAKEVALVTLLMKVCLTNKHVPQTAARNQAGADPENEVQLSSSGTGYLCQCSDYDAGSSVSLPIRGGSKRSLLKRPGRLWEPPEVVFNMSGLLFHVAERPERDAHHWTSSTADRSCVHVFISCAWQLYRIHERKAGQDIVLANPYLFGILMTIRRCKTLSLDTASSNYVSCSGRGLIWDVMLELASGTLK